MDGGQDCSDTNIDSEIKSCNVDPCPIGTESLTSLIIYFFAFYFHDLMTFLPFFIANKLNQTFDIHINRWFLV